MFTLFALLAAAASSPSLSKPATPSLPSLTMTDCENPKARSARLEEIDGDKGWTGSADQFNSDWKSYLSARMDKLGMSESEQGVFLDNVTQSKEFKALQAKNEAILTQMGKDFETVKDSDNEEGACKTVVRMLGALTPMMQNATQQYELMDMAIIAEAKRRKISLDD